MAFLIVCGPAIIVFVTGFYTYFLEPSDEQKRQKSDNKLRRKHRRERRRKERLMKRNDPEAYQEYLKIWRD